MNQKHVKDENLQYLMEEYGITHKTILQHGKSNAIGKNHFALRYNIVEEETQSTHITGGRFEILAIDPIYINDNLITQEDGFVEI